MTVAAAAPLVGARRAVAITTIAAHTRHREHWTSLSPSWAPGEPVHRTLAAPRPGSFEKFSATDLAKEIARPPPLRLDETDRRNCAILAPDAAASLENIEPILE